MSDRGSPLIVALAIADARSSVGCSRREAVTAVKYVNISSSAAICSSFVLPRCNSGSSLPNIFWVYLSIRGKSSSGRPSIDMITYSGSSPRPPGRSRIRSPTPPCCRRNDWRVHRYEPSTPASLLAEPVGTDRTHHAMRRIVHVDECVDATAACCSSASAVINTGRGELVNRALSRSIAMMSACLVIAQNGR